MNNEKILPLFSIKAELADAVFQNVLKVFAPPVKPVCDKATESTKIDKVKNTIIFLFVGF
ncbi:hypothetical protein [Ferruginibacter sp.]|uniref:hypothetical protein n=1 Tax=Ferruginibacter sp. TaxID=1940288 RepID=UPI00199A3E94|nr:hypothetical protein [Ferruginibacter sp.]MBC7629421.1 hypothetical protein [Ferruginibacter sp.]